MDEKDQRKSLIYLTDKGRSLCSDIKSSLEKGEAMLFQNFFRNRTLSAETIFHADDRKYGKMTRGERLC